LIQNIVRFAKNLNFTSTTRKDRQKPSLIYESAYFLWVTASYILSKETNYTRIYFAWLNPYQRIEKQSLIQGLQLPVPAHFTMPLELNYIAQWVFGSSAFQTFF